MTYSDWETVYTLNFEGGLLKSYSYLKNKYTFDTPTSTANTSYTYSDDNYSWTIVFSSGSISTASHGGYYRISTSSNWESEWHSEGISSVDANGNSFYLSSDGYLSGGGSVGRGDDKWYYIRVRGIAGGSLSNRYYYLGTDTAKYENTLLQWYGTSLSSVTSRINSSTTIYWYDDHSTNGANATYEYYYSLGETYYRQKITTTSYINPSNASGYYVEGSFTLHTAGSSTTSEVSRVYLYPSRVGTYRMIGEYYLSGSSNLHTLKTDGTEYIQFSIGSSTLYLFYNGTSYKVYRSAPTTLSSGSTTITVNINAQETPSAADRTFYFGCAKMSYGTSSTGSSAGRQNIVNSSSVNNCYLIFNTDGTLNTISKQSGTPQSVSDRIVGIKNIATGQTSLGSKGMVFAGGYLIKDGCNLL